MPSSRRARLLAATATTSVLATSVVLAVTAPAQATSPRPHVRPNPVAAAVHAGAARTGARLSATFALRTRAPRADALARLAARPVHTPAARAAHVERLRSWQPARTTERRVTRWARAHGLTVDLDDRWLVAVSGTPAQMASAFGVPIGLRHARGSGKRYLAAVKRVRIPAPLRGAVTAVAGLDNRPVAQPRFARRVVGPRAQTAPSNGWRPAALRRAYGVAGTGRGVTVGTVQFAPMYRGGIDVAAYAHHTGIELTDGQFQPVSVRGANVSCNSCGSGEGEVALDLEMVLAAAPEATQRVYIAKRTSSFEVPFAALADDAEAGLVQVASVSWGFCELAAIHDSSGNPDPSGRHYLDRILRPTIQRIVAAGATLFAASGDNGAHDCRDALPAFDPDQDAVGVDIPASIPEVVGVGGTALTVDDTASAPTSTDYAESGWYTPGPIGDPSGDSGGGGGYSAHFARPAYQNDVTVADGDVHPSRRLVPDISAVADPDTGVFECDGVFGGCGGGVGGTSAGAPLSAGALASTLSAAGRPFGLGDIHAALYDAVSADPSDVRDVVDGANDTYSTGDGYDLITGLGSPLWRRLGPDIGLAHAPSVQSGLFRAVRPHTVFASHGKLGPHATRTIDLTTRGVPRTATAAALEVTTTRATRAGALSIFAPGSATHPANVVHPAHRSSTSEVTARLDDGRVRVHNLAGHTHVAIAIDGWYGARGAHSAYHALPHPRHAFDRAISGHAAESVRLRGNAGVPKSATAVALRLSVGQQSRASSLTVRPAGTHGGVRALYWRGDTPALNRVSLKLGRGGRVVLAGHGGTARITGVVEGYWAPASVRRGAAYHPVTPALLLDTRTGAGLGGDAGKLKAGFGLKIPITGINGGLGLGVPATGVTAVVLDVVGHAGPAVANVAGYPAGSSSRPSALLWRGGDPAGVSLLARPGRHGTFVLLNRSGAVHLTVTVEGYFTR